MIKLSLTDFSLLVSGRKIVKGDTKIAMDELDYWAMMYTMQRVISNKESGSKFPLPDWKNTEIAMRKTMKKTIGKGKEKRGNIHPSTW